MIEINGTFRDKPRQGLKCTTASARKAVKSLFVAATPDGGVEIEYHDGGLDFDIWIKPNGQCEMICISPRKSRGGGAT